MKDLEIIFEDNHLLAVNKKCGVLVQADKTGDPSLEQDVKQYIKEKYNKPGEAFLGVPHRIDRPTSGIVLFAKSSKALVRINAMLQEGNQMKKIYWAIVDKRPPLEHETITHFIYRDTNKNKSVAYTKASKYTKEAKLTYTLIGATKHYALLEIDLHTGRHHQIRAQLAKIGCHIKGDLKYGAARSNEDGGIHLHARVLEFIHPVTKEKITLKARPPHDPLWMEFMGLAGK